MPPIFFFVPRAILVAFAVALLVALGLAMVFATDVLAAGGDPVAGEAIYGRCQGCHSIDRNRTGPKHQGLFGRKAGSVAGYDYSKAIQESGIVWDEATLDKFLENPRAMVPGTRMTYAGVKDPQERADLIAYLKAATAPPAE